MNYKYSFGSYSELVAAVTSRPTYSPNVSDWQTEVDGVFAEQRGATKPAWFGWPGKAAMPIAELTQFFLVDGWAHGVRKMRETMQQINAPVVTSVRRRQVWGSEGSELSREKLYAGDIDTMYRTTRRQVVVSPTRIRIVFNSWGHTGIKPEQMFWGGAAGTVLTEALVEAGYAVELVATAKCRDSYDGVGDTFHIETIFKAFDQPFNLASTLAITAHPSFLRQLFFTAQTALMPRRSFYGKGYGMDIDVADYASPGVTTLLVSLMQDAREANAWVTQSLHTLEGTD